MTGRERSEKPRRRFQVRPAYVIGTLVLIAYAVFVLVPFIWTASIAFKPPEDYVAIPPRLIPSEWTRVHFEVLGQLGAWTGLRNSRIVSIASASNSVAPGTPAR